MNTKVINDIEGWAERLPAGHWAQDIKEQYLQRRLRVARPNLLSALDGSDSVGYALFYTTAVDNHLAFVVTHPDRRRRGIFRRLLSEVATTGGEPVEATPANDLGQKVMKKLGFKEYRAGIWKWSLKSVIGRRK